MDTNISAAYCCIHSRNDIIILVYTYSYGYTGLTLDYTGLTLDYTGLTLDYTGLTLD